MEAVYERPNLSKLKDYLLSFQYERARRALELGCPWTPELSELFRPKDVLWLLEERYQVTWHACFRCYLEYPNSHLFTCDAVGAMNTREEIEPQKLSRDKRKTLETAMLDVLLQFDSVAYDDRPEAVRRLVRDLPPSLRQHVANLSLYLAVADVQLIQEESTPWKPEDFVVDEEEEDELSV